MSEANSSIFKAFAELIREKLGIIYTEATYYQLESRLESAAKHFGFANIRELHSNLSSIRKSEIEDFILDLATNNETSFFRDLKVFNAISKEILKPLADQNRSIHIWSAACSTGQEPYSLAMTLEGFKDKNPTFNYKITATDYSQRALNKASSGQYSQLEVQRGLSSLNLVKHFDQIEDVSSKTGNCWQVKSDLKSHIRFSHFNLLEAWQVSGPFDLILCRNVLIYQKKEMRSEILVKMRDFLKPNGCLVLGCAESVPSEANLESEQHAEARFYRRLDDKHKAAV